MLAEYYKERFGYETLQTEWGFLSYSIVLPWLAMQEMYIKPEFRGQGKGKEFIKQISEIAKDNGCTHLWAQVWLNDFNASNTMKACLAVDFKLINSNNGRIVMLKEIDRGE